MKKTVIFLRVLTVVSIILGAICLSLFQRWEPSVESWGYWVFARILEESRQFVFLGRSPFYVLYLTFFRWMGYPISVDIEYLVTTFIASFSIFIFSQRFFRTPVALLASFVWIPYMQVSEPPTQKIALALSIFALIMRQRSTTRFNVSVSYALLVLAYMTRSTYVYLLLFQTVVDICSVIRKRLYTTFKILPKTDWPIFAAVLFYIVVIVSQSSHPWNNIWFANAQWFPYDGKKFEIIPSYNIGYIQENFGNIAVHDFYFTNKEVFNGATTTIGAIVENPTFVARQMGRFFAASVPMIINMTIFPQLSWFPRTSNLLSVIVIFLLFIGALITSIQTHTLYVVFLLGSVGMIVISIIYLPSHRYLFPLIPVLIMSAHWYALRINSLVMRIIRRGSILFIVSGLLLIVFSSPRPIENQDSGWFGIIRNAVNGLSQRKLQFMTDETNNPYTSAHMRMAYDQLTSLVKNCNGILTLESTFVAAFTDVPLKKVYDVWEIPPFGHLDDSVYQGLTPRRVDCLLVSDNLKFSMGMPTNHQIRYQNYVQPYISYLETMGARVTSLPSYGRVVMFIRNK